MQKTQYNKHFISDIYFYQEGPGVRKWQFTSEGVKLINVGNINNGKIDLNATKIYLSEEEANDKYKHFLIDEGDLLIACSGVVVDNFHNKIAFIKKEHLPLCLNTSTMRFKELSERKGTLNFLRYFLQTIEFKEQLRKLITGSAQLNFGPSHIRKIQIPLPTLDTQQKIAIILDKADELRQYNKQLIEKYEALTQSLFLDMFGDPVRNDKGWKSVQVENVASSEKHSIKAGPFGSSLKKEFYVEKGYKIYGQEQVIKDDMTFGNYYIDEKKYKELESCKVKEGDVLVSLVGTYGKISVIPSKFEKGIINPRLMKISPNKDIIRPDFLKFLLQSSHVEKQLKNYSRGGTMDIINVGIIRKVFIPLPPINIQNQFAERIAIIEAQKQQVQEALAKSEALFQGLLQQAFNGELN
jgi:type I restriction enzyme S subunit